MKVRGSAYVWVLAPVFAIALSYSWQAKKAPQKPTPKPTQEPAQNTTLDKPQVVVIGRKEPATFPNPWPAPLARPEGTVDEVAEILARKVLAGGSDALPALERAALECGFSIHDEKGQELYKPAENLAVGVSMLDFDLFVAADITAQKKKTTLADLQKQSTQYPALKGISLIGLFATTTNEYGDEGEESSNKRFWGQFVQALATESDGEFDAPCIGSEDAQLCGAQVTWLLYMATAQATVAAAGPTTEPAKTNEEPPAANPPTAEDPPPHGPKLLHQNPQIDVITNLNQALQLSAAPNFQQALQQWTNQGYPPNMAMLEMCRLRIIDMGLTILNSPPQKLIRTKVYNQKGGNSMFSIDAELQIDADMRRRYQQAVALFPQARPLPPDGQIGGQISIGPPAECELQSFTTITGGMKLVTLIGKPQTQHLSQNPTPIDLDRKIDVTIQTSLGTKSFTLPIVIRDWISAGLTLLISADVEGGGKLKFPGGQTLRWSFDRHLAGDIDLTEFLAAPFVHAGSTDSARYNSWMQYPQNANYTPQLWKYSVNDLYKSTDLVRGCGVRTNPTTTTWGSDKDRPADADEIPGLKFAHAYGELDRKANAVAVQTELPKMPIVSQPGGRKERMALLNDVTLPSTTPNDFGQQLKILDMPTPGAATGGFHIKKVFAYVGTYDVNGDGNKKVDVKFEVEVFHIPGSTFAGPQLAAEWKAAKTATSQLITSLLEESSSSKRRFGVRESIPAGHGPLWISDANAATCSEVDIEDDLPPSAS